MKPTPWTYAIASKTLFRGDKPFAVITAPDGAPLSPRQQQTLLTGLKRAELAPIVEAVAYDLEVCAKSDTLNVAEVCADWAKRLRRALRRAA